MAEKISILLCKKWEYNAGGRGGVPKYQDRREEEVREHR